MIASRWNMPPQYSSDVGYLGYIGNLPGRKGASPLRWELLRLQPTVTAAFVFSEAVTVWVCNRSNRVRHRHVPALNCDVTDVTEVTDIASYGAGRRPRRCHDRA